MNTPAVEHGWHVSIVGPYSYDNNRTWGGGLLFRTTWRVPGSGDYNVTVDDSGYYDGKVTAAQWATSLPLFGLPESFTGLRLVGDREVSRWEERAHGRVTSGTSETFGLVHGGPPGRPGQSYLQVLSSTLPGPEPTALLTAEAERPESDNSLDDAREFAISISLDGNDCSKHSKGASPRPCWPPVILVTIGPRQVPIPRYQTTHACHGTCAFAQR